ncbi:MAG: insulinase family protein [Rikenellaceae bacterium]|nr:insulinase family protein [Rikenellaceae bacterium]
MISGKTGCGLSYAVRRSSSSVAFCSLSVRCGTRDEEGFHSGIAHFTEHTIFKGTAHKSASVINSYLDRLGGELNAYTTKEEIVFHATVLKEDLPKAAGLLFELATEASFPDREIETEKGVVIDEINSYKDSPADDIYDKFEEALFEGHPLGRPILGTASSVRAITSEELRTFVKENFTPDRMAFCIVANIDEKKLEAQVNSLSDKHFGTQSLLSANETKAPVGIPCNIFDRTVNRRSHEVNAVLGGLAPSLYSEDRIVSVLLANILGGPASNSILNSVLREKNGWVYGVECAFTQYRDSGIMTISIGCEKENLDKCFREIFKAIHKLQDKAMSERRLKAAKKQLLGQLAISSESNESQCLSMGKSLLAYGRVASSEENCRIIKSITTAELQECARRIFAEESLSRLIFL